MTLIDPRLWLAAIVALILAYGGGRWQQHGHDVAVYAAEKTAAALAAAREQVKAVDDARAEEQRRTNEQSKVAQDATKQAEQARRDRIAADGVSERLRARVAGLLAAGRPTSSPATAGGSAPARTADALLAELFRRADQRAGSLAADLDAARNAGLACERSYDALTPSAAGTP